MANPAASTDSALPEDPVEETTDGNAQDFKLYYDYAYAFDYMTIGVPFGFALLVYSIVFTLCNRFIPHRQRKKKLISR